MPEHGKRPGSPLPTTGRPAWCRLKGRMRSAGHFVALHALKGAAAAGGGIAATALWTYLHK